MSESTDSLYDFSNPSPAVIQSTAMGDPTLVGQATIEHDGSAVPIVTVGGRAVGSYQWAASKVLMAQLTIDPRLTARPNFGTDADHQEDEDFLLLVASIDSTKINVEPMICEASTKGETVMILGEEQPLLYVRGGVRRYWALKKLGFPEALVRVLPPEVDQRERALMGLLQNELRQPLSILDRCDVVYILDHVYNIKQAIIARRVGYSQGYISKLVAAAEQPAVLRSFLSRGSLTLAQVYELSKVTDETQRELAARYVVLHAPISSTKFEELIGGLCVPAEHGGPTLLMLPPETPKGDVTMRSLVAEVAAPSSPPPERSATKPIPYWKRTTPLMANPVRLLNNRHHVTISGPPEAPVVDLAGLQSVAFIHRLDRQKATAAQVEALEEAMLADLEAIRAALEEADEDVDADLSVAPSSRIVDAGNATG